MTRGNIRLAGELELAQPAPLPPTANLFTKRNGGSLHGLASLHGLGGLRGVRRLAGQRRRWGRWSLHGLLILTATGLHPTCTPSPTAITWQVIDSRIAAA